MPKAQNQIEWNKRCRRSENDISEHRTWKTKCGRYKVVEINIKLGRRNDEHGNFLGYPVFHLAYALRGVEGDWKQLSEHRRPSAARKQCEYHHRYGCIKPKQTKEAKAVRRAKVKRKARKRNEQ